ncbi:MAG: hypothetical protein AAF798_22065 [Bacteroidota bacterium]
MNKARKFYLSKKILQKLTVLLGWIGLLLCILPQHGKAQDIPASEIAAIVTLDSFVVTAQRKGFSIKDFVGLVQTDQSFYQAFRNLRFVNYRATNNVQFFNKKGHSVALHQSTTQQHSDGTCRSMETLARHIGGHYMKKDGDLRYYTAKMFEKVFFTQDTICDDPTDTTIDSEQNLKGIQKHYKALKRLIFQPGEKVSVPFIGKKMAIFSPDMMEYYDYSIHSVVSEQGRDCYVFRLEVKPAFKDRKKKKTVVKFMETYFDKENFQVIARNYHLTYRGAFFSFDVRMEIDLSYIQGKYLPSRIQYDGWWDIPFKRQEKGRFEVHFNDFRVP